MRLPFWRHRAPSSAASPDIPVPRRGSPAEIWLRRGEKAVGSLRDLSRSVAPGPMAGELTDIAGQAATTLDGLRRVAGQVAVVEQAISRIPSPALTERRARLAGAADEDSLRALADIDAALATDRRLRATRDTLLARLESATTALEGLLARAAEVSTFTGVTAEDTGEIGELAAQLDGLRAGLSETERLTRDALGS